MIDITKYQTTGPGKFEGEPPETQYYYDLSMEGDGESIIACVHNNAEGEYDGDFDEPEALLFHINAEEAEAFDAVNVHLPQGHWFMLREDSQGFVLGSVHATREEAEAKFRSWLGL